MKKLVCLESEWDGWEKPKSVLPMLQMLSYRENGRFAYIHKHCNSEESVRHNIVQIGKRKSIDVIYIAMHGTQGHVYPDPGKDGISLEKLALLVESNWQGRVVHFGSCSVMRSENAVLKFQKATGVALVSGFRRDIDWDLSTAFDYLCLVNLLNNNVNKRLVSKLHNLAKGPFEELGFASCWKGNYCKTGQQ